MRVLAHDVAHFAGDATDGCCVGTDDAELHGEADRRPEVEAIDTDPRLSQRAVCNRTLQS